MPKPLSITIEVEEVAAGGVIRLLNRTAGVVALHLNLDADVRPPPGTKKNGEMRKVRGGPNSTRAVLYRVLASGKGKPVHRDQIKAALNPTDETKGRTAARNAIYNTMRQGFVKQTGKHHFELTDKGKKHLAALQE